VGTTGLIFAGIAIAWLAYLVPHFVRRRDGEPDVDDDAVDPFSESVRILRHGTAPLLDQDLAELREFEVSTPVTRRAAIADLRRLERVAASRRRRVLSALFAILCAVISVCSMSWLPWWTVAVPGGLVLLFVVVSRFSVRAMRRDLDARYVAIARGSDEQTVLISRKDAVAEAKGKVKARSKDSDARPGLWDPLPITVPTYVSKPLAPRTVRTIDLSAPDVTSSGRQSVPVTADAPQETVAEVGEAREQAGGSHAASA
jgi:hypothetical protein